MDSRTINNTNPMYRLSKSLYKDIKCCPECTSGNVIGVCRKHIVSIRKERDIVMRRMYGVGFDD